MTLQAQLDAILARARATRPAEWLATMDAGLAELRRSGIAERCRKAGDPAPSFALPNGGGTLIRSADLLAKGPLVVSFYRGTW
jgi:hypothetical protein